MKYILRELQMCVYVCEGNDGFQPTWWLGHTQNSWAPTERRKSEALWPRWRDRVVGRTEKRIQRTENKIRQRWNSFSSPAAATPLFKYRCANVKPTSACMLWLLNRWKKMCCFLWREKALKWSNVTAGPTVQFWTCTTQKTRKQNHSELSSAQTQKPLTRVFVWKCKNVQMMTICSVEGRIYSKSKFYEQSYVQFSKWAPCSPLVRSYTPPRFCSPADE